MVKHPYGKEKGDAGLVRRMGESGLSWIWDGTSRLTEDIAAADAVIAAYTLDDAKFYAKERVKAYAKELRDQALADMYSAFETSSWTTKAAEAKAYIDWDDKGQSGTKPTVDFISDEATKAALIEGTVTERTIADRIVKNALTASAFETSVAGTSTGHKAKIDALTTFAEVEAYDWSTGWPDPTVTLTNK